MESIRTWQEKTHSGIEMAGKMHHSNSVVEFFLNLVVSKQALGSSRGEMTLGQIF